VSRPFEGAFKDPGLLQWNRLTDEELQEMRNRYMRFKKDLESRPLIMTPIEEEYLRVVNLLFAEIGHLRLFVRDKIAGTKTQA
jgi:hypothetical protein